MRIIVIIICCKPATNGHEKGAARPPESRRGDGRALNSVSQLFMALRATRSARNPKSRAAAEQARPAIAVEGLGPPTGEPCRPRRRHRHRLFGPSKPAQAGLEPRPSAPLRGWAKHRAASEDWGCFMSTRPSGFAGSFAGPPWPAARSASPESRCAPRCRPGCPAAGRARRSRARSRNAPCHP